MRTLVLLNRNAGSGQAASNWQRLASKLANLLGVKPAVYDETCDWRSTIEEALRSGPCLVTAAGGDGTVHRVANLVLALPPELRARTVFGALGFGSSNDFHKPVAGPSGSLWPRPQGRGRPGGWSSAAGASSRKETESPRFLGIPARCWPGRTVQQNVLEISYLDPCGRWHDEYALLSASIGMVALGNDLFNRRWGPLGAVRALGTSAGIWCASFAGLWRQEGIPVELWVDGRPAYTGATCLLSFYVNRHIGGQLSYPAPSRSSADGHPGEARMGISLLADVDVARRLYLLGRAATTELPGPPQTLLWWARTARCSVPEPTLLEMDGEVVRAQELRVRLAAKALRVCA